uniref:Uncharacterized protein n=1 Tax=Arundo donax TaxID=35708 RepID=A0A0A9DK29_ARUDO
MISNEFYWKASLARPLRKLSFVVWKNLFICAFACPCL